MGWIIPKCSAPASCRTGIQGISHRCRTTYQCIRSVKWAVHLNHRECQLTTLATCCSLRACHNVQLPNQLQKRSLKSRRRLIQKPYSWRQRTTLYRSHKARFPLCTPIDLSRSMLEILTRNVGIDQAPIDKKRQQLASNDDPFPVQIFDCLLKKFQRLRKTK